MNQSRVYHRQAMALVEPHFIAGVLGEGSDAQDFYFDNQKALVYEIMSLLLAMDNDKEAQPTRAVLARSAACIAVDAKMFDVAKGLCRFGLEGYPPEKIKLELEETLAFIGPKEAV